MIKAVSILAFWVSFSFCQNGSILQNLIANRNVDGVIVIKKLGSSELLESDSIKAKIEVLPASTFKIANTLIALDGGYISLKDTIIWDGKDRGNPQWNQSHTIRSAFKCSCVWCYEKIEKKIGIKIYNQELERIQYGNATAGAIDTSFWLYGDLRISAEQQVDFLERLISQKLGFKESSYEITEDIMKDIENVDYTIYAKTGWVGGIGWYVGYVKKENGCWIFATRLSGVTKDNGLLKTRQEITIEALKRLKII